MPWIRPDAFLKDLREVFDISMTYAVDAVTIVEAPLIHKGYRKDLSHKTSSQSLIWGRDRWLRLDSLPLRYRELLKNDGDKPDDTLEIYEALWEEERDRGVTHIEYLARYELVTCRENETKRALLISYLEQWLSEESSDRRNAFVKTYAIAKAAVEVQLVKEKESQDERRRAERRNPKDGARQSYRYSSLLLERRAAAQASTEPITHVGAKKTTNLRPHEEIAARPKARSVEVIRVATPAPPKVTIDRTPPTKASGYCQG